MLFGEFEPYLDLMDRRNESVSKWSVGMHIHHSILVGLGIAERLEASNPGGSKPSFSLLRSTVFLTRTIPRGRGKASESVIPDESPQRDEIIEGLQVAGQVEARISRMPRSKWWKHGIFGVMDPRGALKFIEVHNHHHLKIIEDILRF